jgi:hypothetical protein
MIGPPPIFLALPNIEAYAFFPKREACFVMLHFASWHAHHEPSSTAATLPPPNPLYKLYSWKLNHNQTILDEK